MFPATPTDTLTTPAKRSRGGCKSPPSPSDRRFSVTLPVTLTSHLPGIICLILIRGMGVVWEFDRSLENWWSNLREHYRGVGRGPGGTPQPGFINTHRHLQRAQNVSDNVII